MFRSIQRLARLIPRLPVFPVAMVVVGIHGNPDPTRRATGYDGVLPVPVTAPALMPARHLDPLLEQQRRDMRAARGRVLYSAGKGPDSTRARQAGKTPCPEHRVVQDRMAPSSPSS